MVARAQPRDLAAGRSRSGRPGPPRRPPGVALPLVLERPATAVPRGAAAPSPAVRGQAVRTAPAGPPRPHRALGKRSVCRRVATRRAPSSWTRCRRQATTRATKAAPATTPKAGFTRSGSVWGRYGARASVSWHRAGPLLWRTLPWPRGSRLRRSGQYGADRSEARPVRRPLTHHQDSADLPSVASPLPPAAAQGHSHD